MTPITGRRTFHGLKFHPFGRSHIVTRLLQSGYCTARRSDVTPHASMMKEPLHPAKDKFCIHLIAISGPQRRPNVRMLFVATGGAHAVYEGQGSWSKCIRLIQQLPLIGITKQDLAAARKDFGRDQYATLQSAEVSLGDLESLGLQRVDS
jgi:hypothetical protein